MNESKGRHGSPWARHRELFAACLIALTSSAVTATPAAPAAVWRPSPGHVQVPIWPGTPPDLVPDPQPESEASTHVSRPTLTVYAPKGRNTGTAVVVFPGGGYQVLAMGLEGTEICDWIAALSPVRVSPVITPVMPFVEGYIPGSSSGGTAGMADPKMLVVAVWLAGVAVSALLLILLQRRFALEVRKGSIGPAVVGVIAPRVVTPADFELKFSGEEQALVLAHEHAHIERQDSRLNGVSAALQCLFWFNPLVHLAAHLMRIDQEMACDETVVTRFPEARRAYAQALVKAQLAIRPLPLGCYWLRIPG